jgi:hypothetical protein
VILESVDREIQERDYCLFMRLATTAAP